MTDLHLRILRLVATRRQRTLDDHEATGHADGSAGADHGRELEQAAGQAHASVAAAETRRRDLPSRRAP